MLKEQLNQQQAHPSATPSAAQISSDGSARDRTSTEESTPMSVELTPQADTQRGESPPNIKRVVPAPALTPSPSPAPSPGMPISPGLQAIQALTFLTSSSSSSPSPTKINVSLGGEKKFISPPPQTHPFMATVTSQPPQQPKVVKPNTSPPQPILNKPVQPLQFTPVTKPLILKPLQPVPKPTPQPILKPTPQPILKPTQPNIAPPFPSIGTKPMPNPQPDPILVGTLADTWSPRKPCDQSPEEQGPQQYEVQDYHVIPMFQWNPQTVVSWLSEKVDPNQFSQLFLKNGIDGIEFFYLTEEILKTFLSSVPSNTLTIGTRKKIFTARQQYLNQYSPSGRPKLSGGDTNPPLMVITCCTKPLHEWTPMDVSNVFKEIGLSHRAELFVEENIDGIELAHLTSKELSECLRISSYGERAKIQRILKQFPYQPPQAQAHARPLDPSTSSAEEEEGTSGMKRFISLPLTEWSMQDLKEGLEWIGLKEFAEMFFQQDIDGSLLTSISKQELKDDFGLWRFGDLKKLNRLIKGSR